MNRVFRSLAVFACLAAVAVAESISIVSRAIVATARAVGDWIGGLVTAAVEIFRLPKDWRDIDRPAAAFVQARAFVMRLAKRQRPITTPRWRMCPST